MRFSFRLPPKLVADYARMQARIHKIESIEWSKFAESVNDYYENHEDGDEVEENAPQETELEMETREEPTPATSTVQPVEADVPMVTIPKPEPKEEPAKAPKPLRVKRESLDETEDETRTDTNTNNDDNGSESGKRKVVRWTPEEDIFLRELMKRHDNDFVKVSQEMKSRNVSQCKGRWKLLTKGTN